MIHYKENEVINCMILINICLWEDFRLGPQSGIVCFGMGNDRCRIEQIRAGGT